MLQELHIAGLGVIGDVDLDLHPGLNVLTGETGAGKTMVTVALSLAIGARASVTAVARSAHRADVQARFDATDDADGWAEDGEVVLARSVGREGKGAARINGHLATASALAELGGSLIEIHGQHQAQRLLSPALQTAFLDRFAGDAHVVALAAYRESHDRLRRARAEWTSLGEAARARERELDLLAYQVREIEAVGPAPGETEDLTAVERRLGHVERLLELAGVAGAALSDEGGAADASADVAASLRDAAALDPGAADLDRRAAAVSAEVGELARDVRAYRESLAADPAGLAAARERIAALRNLQRKYGDSDADVLAFLAAAREQLAALTGADERLAALEAQIAELTEERAERGARVSAARHAAAPRLATALADQLVELGMPGASIHVDLQPLDDAGPGGFEQAELRFSGGAGQAAMPLAKAASGGELSRVMLACRTVLADVDAVPTLVFDEVDAGIGGEAGLAVGRRLASLARDRQVLVVTHLPQIAAFADRQFCVRKVEGAATVTALEADERLTELSRMLAGFTGSESARSHATELVAAADAYRADLGAKTPPASKRSRVPAAG